MVTLIKAKGYAKNIVVLFGLAVLFIGLLFLSPAYSAPERLCIVYTNDMHGHMLPSRDFSMRGEPKPMLGGMVVLGSYLKEVRAEARQKGFDVFLFDAGDIFHGTPEGNVHKGRSMVKAMNALKYQAAALGNHEFAFGLNILKKISAELKFPFLACNLFYTAINKQSRFWQYELMLKSGDLKIGVTGVITPKTKYINFYENIKGLEFSDPYDCVAEQIKSLKKQGADIIIVLSHLGLKKDKKLASRVSGIDVIIGGHSHDIIDPVLLVGKTLICQAGSYNQRVGRLDLWLDPETKKIVDYDNTVNNLFTWEYKPDKGMRKIVAEFLVPGMDEVIGYAQNTFWSDMDKESPLGNLVTDAMREAVDADVAIISGAGLRCGLSKGDITLRDLYNISPFGNILYTVEMRGRDIKELIKKRIKNDKSYIQVSGIKIVSEYSSSGIRSLYVKTKNNKELENMKKYTMVTSNYMALVDRDFKEMFYLYPDNEQGATSIMVYKALESYIRKNVPLTRGPINRIIFDHE